MPYDLQTVRNRLAAGWATLVLCWWAIVDVARIAWACRAPLLSVFIGFALIAWTDQARDIVIATGNPDQRDSSILKAVVTWALIAWFWARVTLNDGLLPAPGAVPQWWRDFWTSNVPRLIGAAGILSMAFAFFAAADIYAAAGDATRAVAFRRDVGLYEIYTLLFLFAVGLRRSATSAAIAGLDKASRLFQVLTPDDTPISLVPGFGNLIAWIVGLVSLATSAIFFVLVLHDPVGMNTGVFGNAVPAVLLGLGLMVPVASALVIASRRVGFPFFAIAVIWISLAPMILGDNHAVRTCRDFTRPESLPVWCSFDPNSRPTLEGAFHDWWNANKGQTRPITAGSTEVIAPPMILVATAGGASRAAFWTTQVLGAIAQREARFADRIFLISGVSGGSLGATAFRAIVEADRRASDDKTGSPLLKDAAAKGAAFIENDFLGPTLTTGLYVDLPVGAVSLLFTADDRAATLEKSWEQAWDRTGISAGLFAWSQGFNYVLAGGRPWPVLALNGTSVETGKRIITSNVRFWTPAAGGAQNMSGGANRYDAFDIIKSDIPVSTAVTMSARFPVISPTGGLKEPGGSVRARVTDGGLFENFGALTADEVLRYLVFRRSEVQGGAYQTIPIAILISSDPSLDNLGLRQDGVANGAPPDCPPPEQSPQPTPVIHPGNGEPECRADVKQNAELLADPAIALYDGRVARGEAAATALLDRIRDARIAVRDRLLKAMSTAEKVPANDEGLFNALQARVGLDDHVDFFHFRQCRVPGVKGPTMSWHDSSEAWEVMTTMLGLPQGPADPKTDPCGNRAEFFRLCVRLARLTGTSPDDQAATDACKAKGWPWPDGWTCNDKAHGGSRPYCYVNAPQPSKD